MLANNATFRLIEGVLELGVRLREARSSHAFEAIHSVCPTVRKQSLEQTCMSCWTELQ